MKHLGWLKYCTQVSLPVALVLSAGLLCTWLPELLAHPWLVVPTLVLALVNGGLFWQLVRVAGFVRERDGLPVFLYTLAVSALPDYYTQWGVQLALLVLLLTMLLLHRGYREQDSTEDAFGITLLLLLASLVVPDMAWCLPVVLISYLVLRSFEMRVFTACLLGVALFAVYYAIAWWQGWVEWQYDQLWVRTVPVAFFHTTSSLPLLVLLGSGVLLLIGSFARLDRDSTNQQNLLLLLLEFYLLLAGLGLFPGTEAVSTLPMALVLMSGISVVWLRQRETIFRGLVFLLLAAAFLASRIIA